eukprot:330410-Prymnesium_polylepis.1
MQRAAQCGAAYVARPPSTPARPSELVLGLADVHELALEAEQVLLQLELRVGDGGHEAGRLARQQLRRVLQVV